MLLRIKIYGRWLKRVQQGGKTLLRKTKRENQVRISAIDFAFYPSAGDAQLFPHKRAQIPLEDTHFGANPFSFSLLTKWKQASSGSDSRPRGEEGAHGTLWSPPQEAAALWSWKATAKDEDARSGSAPRRRPARPGPAPLFPARPLLIEVQEPVGPSQRDPGKRSVSNNYYVT